MTTTPQQIVDSLLALAGDGEPQARVLYKALIKLASKGYEESKVPPLATAVAHLFTAVDLLLDPAVCDDATASHVMQAFAEALPLLRANRPPRQAN